MYRDAAAVSGLPLDAGMLWVMPNDDPRPALVFLSHTSELREYPEGGSFVAAAESAVTRAAGVIRDMRYFTAGEGAPPRCVARRWRRRMCTC
jgi:hypothetical protein